jgi:hypothetical protein
LPANGLTWVPPAGSVKAWVSSTARTGWRTALARLWFVAARFHAWTTCVSCGTPAAVNRDSTTAPALLLTVCCTWSTYRLPARSNATPASVTRGNCWKLSVIVGSRRTGPGVAGKLDQLAPPLVETAPSTMTLLLPGRPGSLRTQTDARFWGFDGLMATAGLLSSPAPLETSTRPRIVAAGSVAISVRGSSPSRATRRRRAFLSGRGRDPARRGRTVGDSTAGASGRMEGLGGFARRGSARARRGGGPATGRDGDLGDFDSRRIQ